MTPDTGMERCQESRAGRLVLGEPVEVLNTTLVPVISVTGAFGKAAGDQGEGGGFALNPVAVVALQNGEVNVYSLQPKVNVEKLSAVISGLWMHDDREGTNTHGG